MRDPRGNTLKGPYGLFLSVQLLGLMVHFEVYNGEPATEITVLLGLCISWRQRPILLARFARDVLFDARWLWLEWWSGHKLFLPKPRRGQVGEKP